MPHDNYIQKIFLTLSLLSIFSFHVQDLAAQDHDHHDHDHEIYNELATGGGIAFSTESPGISPAFHVHAIKGLSPHIGIGLGYEVILGDELHQSLAVLLNLKPVEILDINLGPALTLPSHDEPAGFGINAEIGLAFHVTRNLHLGPVFDTGWSLHGLHLITGVHIGFDL